MILANVFIVALAAGSAWLGIAALVEKRTVRRHRREQRSTNAAA